MLPPLDEKGDLPPGVHVAAWNEIEQRFGTGSDARTRALATLKRLHRLANRTHALRSFYVFGSFVSKAPEPRDVDVLMVMNADFRVEACAPAARSLFSHSAAQSDHGATVFWIREGMLSAAAMREFLGALQIRRDGALRGILEVA